MAYTIRLTAGEVAESYQQLQPYARDSLDEALHAAAGGDLRSLVTVPGLTEDFYSLSFARDRGIAVVEIDDDQNMIIVRQIQAPR